MAHIIQWQPRNQQFWYCIALSAAQARHPRIERIAARFESAYLDADMPEGMNLWRAQPADGHIALYMSPVARVPAAPLIERYTARACATPNQPLLLIAGHRYPRPADARPLPRRAHPPLTTRACIPTHHAYPPQAQRLDRRDGNDMVDTNRGMTPFMRRFAQAWAQHATRL